jgi:hypothetical protein
MWYLALYGIFALWVLQDGISRKIGGSVAAWILGTFLLGPIILPVYLAKRPLKRGEVREGGTAWNVLKNFAILWTVLMVIVGFSAMMKVGQTTSSLDSDAAKVGAGLGIMLGLGFLAVVWFVPTVGAAVLGFLLKKNSIVETGPTGTLVGQNSPASFANGWAGLVLCAIVGLILVVVLARTSGKDLTVEKSYDAGPSVKAVDTASTSTAHTWRLKDETNSMDSVKETSLLLESEDQIRGFVGSHSAFLCIRCAKGKIEAYVSVGGPVESEYPSDTYGVRTKFDDDSPVKARWSESTDRKALFAPRAGEFVKRLEDSAVFLFEFTPFQQRETAIKFNVTGLREKLAPIAESCGPAISETQPKANVAVATSHIVPAPTQAKAKEKSQENTGLEPTEPAPSAEATEYKQRLEGAINEKGLTGRATVQMSGNTLTLTGKLRPSEHSTLLKLLRDAKDVRVLDYIGYDDSPLR